MTVKQFIEILSNLRNQDAEILMSSTMKGVLPHHRVYYEINPFRPIGTITNVEKYYSIEPKTLGEIKSEGVTNI